MTYEDAADWAIDNVPTSQFATFEQWRNQVESELMTPELAQESRFQSMLEDRYFGIVSPREEEQVFIEEGFDTQEAFEEIPEPPTFQEQRQHTVEIKEEFRQENIAKTAEKFTFTERPQPTIAEKFRSARLHA